MKKQEFIEGLRDGIPICLGYFSVSTAFGLTAVLSGMPVWAAILISMTNLTSAGQFAGVNRLTANGSLFELAVSTFVINMRYLLMSLSVSQKADRKMTVGQRMGVSFGITDEIFAVSMQRQKDVTAQYMSGLIIISYIGWTAGTALGAVATSFMPDMLTNAMGIALYGMFIAIIVPPMKKERSVLIAVLLSILLSCAFTYLPLLNQLSSGWSVIIITVAVSAVAATLFPIKPGEDEKEILSE